MLEETPFLESGLARLAGALAGAAHPVSAESGSQSKVPPSPSSASQTPNPA